MGIPLQTPVLLYKSGCLRGYTFQWTCFPDGNSDECTCSEHIETSKCISEKKNIHQDNVHNERIMKG